MYHDECFLEGNYAKILIKPQLLIHDVICPLSLLESTLIEVEVKNKDQITSIFQFRDFDKKFNIDGGAVWEIYFPIKNMTNCI